jgi:signal transduction histidine kinase
MHDTIMQGMTGISAQLEAVSGVLADSPAMARIQIDRVRTQARAIVEEARRSIWNLRPKTLDGGNLPAALCTSARELTDGSAVRFQMELIGEHQPLPLHVERNLLRIAQEAIANAVQHGRPEAIRISLFFAADCVRLVVEDNGRGFDPSAFNGRESGHYGLIGMRERAEQMSGRLEVRSNRNAGTRIEAIVPRRECQRVKHAS